MKIDELTIRNLASIQFCYGERSTPAMTASAAKDIAARRISGKREMYSPRLQKLEG